MRYFVAHLLSGDAKKYHEVMTYELSRRFRIEPLHKRVPPHITLKIPFETDAEGIVEIERIIRETLRFAQAPSLNFTGFGRFGFRTIYMNIEKSADAKFFARALIASLAMHAPWLPAVPREGKKLHASVARFLTRTQSGRIWKFLKDAEPEFSTLLDNVAILRKEEKTWKLHTLIPVGDERTLGFMPQHARSGVSAEKVY